MVLSASAETLEMVSAALATEDKFIAGKLLGRATLERVRLNGDESLIASTHRALGVIAQPDRKELEEGFAKAIFFARYVEKYAQNHA